MISSLSGARRLFRKQGPLLVLIGLMFLIYFAQAAFDPSWYEGLMVIPVRIIDSWQHLLDGQVTAADWREFSTLLSCAFLHGDISHVAFNMLYLWIFGALIVELLGWRWMLLILPRIKICGKEIFPLMFRHPIMLGSSND